MQSLEHKANGTEPETSGPTKLQAGKATKPGRTATEFVAVVVAAHLPFVLLYFRDLFRYRPYYHLYPLLLAAVAWLMWKRWPREDPVPTRLTQLIGKVMLLLGLGLLAVSVLVFSPSLGATAAVLSLGGLLVGLQGRAALRELAGPWSLLWLVVPPVVLLADRLVHGLHNLTASAGSRILEQLRVDHALAGTVYQLPGVEIFAAEACGGVHSQLLLVAISLLMAALWRRTLLHALLLATAAVFWTSVLNITRVVILMLAASRWGADLSIGWQHQALGFLLVCLTLLLLWSSDRWLVGILGPVLFAWSPETSKEKWSRRWNKLIAHYEDPSKKPVEQPPAVPVAPAWTASIWAVPFGCLGVLQLLLLLLVPLLVPRAPEVRAGGLNNAFEESWLPPSMGDWHSTTYQNIVRCQCSNEGRFSRRWAYQSDSGDGTAIVSVDFPYVDSHELTSSYTDRGWTEVRRAVRENEAGSFVAVQLRAPDGHAGYLLFSLFDRAAQPVEPETAHPGFLQATLGRGDPLVQSLPTTLQVQQLIERRYPLDEQQQRTAELMYVKLRRDLLQRWQTHVGRVQE